MNLNDRLPGGEQLNHRLTFNVVIAYEDFITGNHALNIVNRLFPGWGQSPSFSTQNVWRFDLLEITKFRETAAAEAANADMVLISAHDPKSLPTAVKRWLEVWIKNRAQNPGAFVVLVDDTRRQGMRELWAESYLQMCAIRAGMDFFIQRADGHRGRKRGDRGGELETDLPSAAALAKIISSVDWRAEHN
jgi:hypothetical protein